MNQTRHLRSLMPSLVLLACAATASAQEKTAEHKRTISVTSQGEVKVTPDRVLLSFAVETTAARATEAAAENAKRSTTVANAVKTLLDKEDTVTTTRYALDPRYENPRPGEAHEPRITGYVARNEVQLESRKIDQVGALIDAATTAGSNRVSGLQFTLSKRDEALRTAIEKAGSSARLQAESVAKGLGVQLGKVLSASTSGSPVAIPRRFEGMAMAAAEARAPTPIEPGEVGVSVSLQVTYEIGE